MSLEVKVALKPNTVIQQTILCKQGFENIVVKGENWYPAFSSSCAYHTYPYTSGHLKLITWKKLH